MRDSVLEQSKKNSTAQLNAESYLGTSIHRVDPQPVLGNQFRSYLPNSLGSTGGVQFTSEYFATVDKAIIVGGEKKALEAVRFGIGALKRAADKGAAAPVELSFSLSRMGNLFPGSS